MNSVLLTPPIAFAIFLTLALIISKITAFISAKGNASPGKTKAYACGEDVAQHKARPEYKQFFHIAFFFTIMHVVALIIATVPAGISPLVVLYLLAAVLALFILFRR